jgi:hypothetical protein
MKPNQVHHQPRILKRTIPSFSIGTSSGGGGAPLLDGRRMLEWGPAASRDRRRMRSRPLQIAGSSLLNKSIICAIM